MRVMLKKGQKMAVKAKSASGFDYPTSLVGTSSWKGSDGRPVTIYYDPATGATGLSAAKYALARIDDLMAYCDWAFGVRGQGGNVIIADTGGGAYHYGCSFSDGGDWYEDVEGDQTTFGLIMAEVTESYMGLQNRGWNCGGSGGESLSRFLAEIVSGGPNGALRDYASGPSWDGTDWISRDQGTDGDYPSIGCGVLYLWWMTKMGFTVDKIVQAGEPTGVLSSNYAALTSKTTAFADFKAAVHAVGQINGDNPFNAPLPPYPLNNPTPVPVPVPVPVPTPTPTPAPQTFTVNIPDQVGYLFGMPLVKIPALTVTGSAAQAQTLSIPPWLLPILRGLCSQIGSLPAKWQPAAALFCSLIPPNAEHMAACGKDIEVTLTPQLLKMMADAQAMPAAPCGGCG